MMLLVLLCTCFMAQQARAAGVVQWQLDKSVYAKGAPIKASFQNIAAPSAKHWVGIWAYPDSGTRAGAWDQQRRQGSLTWAYLPVAADGEITLQGLSSGRYAAFILANDGYEWLSTPIIFQVTDDGVAVRKRAAGQQSTHV